jgi:DNA-binding transcriptional LysR family regulator
VADGAEPAGTLTVGAPETILTYRLPRVLQRFRVRFPRVRLAFRPTPNAELQRVVGDGTIDVGFGLGEPQRPHGLAIEQLHVERLMVVAPSDHPLAATAHVGPGDLQRETLLLTRPGCGYRALFTSTLATAGIQTAATLDFGSVEAIKQCVAAGLGIAALPVTAVSGELADGRLLSLNWAGAPLEVATQMLWHPARAWGASLRAFLEIARESSARTALTG